MYQTERQQAAEALGFASVEQCQSHQAWLGNIAGHREECRVSNINRPRIIHAPIFTEQQL